MDNQITLSDVEKARKKLSEAQKMFELTLEAYHRQFEAKFPFEIQIIGTIL